MGKGGGAGCSWSLAVVAIGGGAGWYFKIYRPKQQKAMEPEEDYDGPTTAARRTMTVRPPWDEGAGGMSRELTREEKAAIRSLCGEMVRQL